MFLKRSEKCADKYLKKLEKVEKNVPPNILLERYILHKNVKCVLEKFYEHENSAWQEKMHKRACNVAFVLRGHLKFKVISCIPDWQFFETIFCSLSRSFHIRPVGMYYEQIIGLLRNDLLDMHEQVRFLKPTVRNGSRNLVLTRAMIIFL